MYIYIYTEQPAAVTKISDDKINYLDHKGNNNKQ